MVGRARGLNQFYSRETLPLILMQFQITDMCLVRIGASTPSVKHHSAAHIITNTVIKQRDQSRSEVRTQENHKQDHDGTGHRHWKSVANLLKQIEKGAMIQSEDRLNVVQLTLSVENFRRHLSSACLYYHLERSLYVKLKDWMSNRVDPDETAHNEPSHLDLCCLQKPIIIACGSGRGKQSLVVKGCCEGQNSAKFYNGSLWKSN